MSKPNKTIESVAASSTYGMVLVKLIEYDENFEFHEREFHTLWLHPESIDHFVKQIRQYGIVWDTTNVTFTFKDCSYGYLPVDEVSENEQVYFKIRLFYTC